MDITFVNILATIFRPILSILALEWNIAGLKFNMIHMFIFCMFVGFIIKKVKDMGNTGGGK